MSGETTAPPPSPLTRDQVGFMAAALIAFLGIVYVGPAWTRFRRQPTLKDRLARRARDMRHQAHKAGGKVRRRVRRLGGGPIFR